eukprot:364323-Chlamydomonas_euryale.AAC.22
MQRCAFAAGIGRSQGKAGAVHKAGEARGPASGMSRVIRSSSFAARSSGHALSTGCGPLLAPIPDLDAGTHAGIPERLHCRQR